MPGELRQNRRARTVKHQTTSVATVIDDANGA